MHVVHLSGSIDCQSVPTVRRQLLDDIHAGDLQIDLSRVTTLDGSGLAALVETFQTAREVGHSVYMTHLSRELLKIVRLARLEVVFALRPDPLDRPTLDAMAAGVSTRRYAGNLDRLRPDQTER